MLERAQWEQCRDIVRELDIPVPWDFEVFCRLLEERRGRPLEVLPVLPVRAGFPNGIFLQSDAVDRIYMVESTTTYHREQIALHEIGHLLLGHRECGLDAARLAPVLFPRLDLSLVKMVLGRGEYHDPQEQQAEYFASLILARTGGRRAQSARDPRMAEAAVRIEGAWGPPPGRRRWSW